MNSLKLILMLFIFSSLVPMGANARKGGESGGGGDAVSQELTLVARDLAKALAAMAPDQLPESLKSVDLSQLVRALNETKIVLTDEKVVDRDGDPETAKFVIEDEIKKIIVQNERFYREVGNRSDRLLGLLLHEGLRSIPINDDYYVYSSGILKPDFLNLLFAQNPGLMQEANDAVKSLTESVSASATMTVEQRSDGSKTVTIFSNGPGASYLECYGLCLKF